MSIKMCRPNSKNDLPQSEHCDANNSRLDDKFQARVLLLQPILIQLVDPFPINVSFRWIHR